MDYGTEQEALDTDGSIYGPAAIDYIPDRHTAVMEWTSASMSAQCDAMHARRDRRAQQKDHERQLIDDLVSWLRG